LLIPVLPVAAQPSVVAYYQELRQSGVAGALPYALSQQGGAWVTTSPDWGTAIPVTVDGPRGYIRILDEGTGGGAFETQIVLWRQADGLPLLGLAETPVGPDASDTRLRFFAHDRHHWDDVTGYAWPGVALSDFMLDTMTVEELRVLQGIRAAIQIVLPREGLSPEARLVLPEAEIRAVCQGEDGYVPADPAPYLTYCRRLEGRLHRVVSFVWDPVAVRFTKAQGGQ
jgi:hypothetical protein